MTTRQFLPRLWPRLALLAFVLACSFVSWRFPAIKEHVDSAQACVLILLVSRAWNRADDKEDADEGHFAVERAVEARREEEKASLARACVEKGYLHGVTDVAHDSRIA